MVAHVPGERMKMPLVLFTALGIGGLSALAAIALPATVTDPLFFAGGDAVGLPHLAGVSGPLFAIVSAIVGAGAGTLSARRLSRAAPSAAAQDMDPLPIPIIRRADAHPDARPRPPLRATYELDLPAWATPKGEAPQEGAPQEDAMDARDLPADLDQPLAAFDPLAIPAVPLPPPVPPRRERAASPAQRASAHRDAADRLVRPETDATVHALLERLERGVVRRNQVSQTRGRLQTGRGLDDALAALRSLARQA